MSRCWLATALVQECGKGGVGPVFSRYDFVSSSNASLETKHKIVFD